MGTRLWRSSRLPSRLHQEPAEENRAESRQPPIHHDGTMGRLSVQRNSRIFITSSCFFYHFFRPSGLSSDWQSLRCLQSSPEVSSITTPLRNSSHLVTPLRSF